MEYHDASVDLSPHSSRDQQRGGEGSVSDSSDRKTFTPAEPFCPLEERSLQAKYVWLFA
jgi:hypothetical protein